MIGKLTGLIILCILLLSMVLPANIAFIHAPGTDKVLVTLDMCHASSPFQPSSSSMPFYPEQISNCTLTPEFSVFSYITSRPLFRPTLFASEKENPPEA